MANRFGHITNGGMHLNAYGQAAHDEWLALTDRFPHVSLREFIIMPNHMHGIICLDEEDHPMWTYGNTGARNMAGGAVRGPLAGPSTPRYTLGQIIGAYKSLTHRRCLDIAISNDQRLGKLWHRNYYEIIIRTPEAMQRIAAYIRNNARQWTLDRFYQK